MAEREAVELEECPQCGDVAAVVHTITLDDDGAVTLDIRGSIRCRNPECENYKPFDSPLTSPTP
jgi:hypothetical protein